MDVFCPGLVFQTQALQTASLEVEKEFLATFGAADEGEFEIKRERQGEIDLVNIAGEGLGQSEKPVRLDLGQSHRSID